MKGVRAKTKPTKREAILNAMLDVVVERGLHDAPMSLIAERSGASAGVIYHHFASKEEIIQALYERVHALKSASFLKGYSAGMEAEQAFLMLWNNAYHFYRKHSREMRFLEQYESAGFVCEVEADRLGAEGAEMQRRFRARAKGGVLNDWPGEVMGELTLGLVARLARLPQKLSPAVLREVGEKMWEAVRADPQ